jgi:hypothetical protein
MQRAFAARASLMDLSSTRPDSMGESVCSESSALHAAGRDSRYPGGRNARRQINSPRLPRPFPDSPGVSRGNTIGLFAAAAGCRTLPR